MSDPTRPPIAPQYVKIVEDADPHRDTGIRRRPRRSHSLFNGLNQHGPSLDSTGPSKVGKLEQLFKPPTDIAFSGTYDEAKLEADGCDRWLLVNLQNVEEFDSQIMNRDIWKNLTIRNVVFRNFVFWLVYDDCPDGERYKRHYKVESWPHVAILDPRTGEKMLEISSADPGYFRQQIESFLSDHPSPSGSDEPPSKRFRNSLTMSSGRENSPTKQPLLTNLSESEQLAAAIKASLQDSVVSTNNKRLNVVDVESISLSSSNSSNGLDDSDDDCVIISDEEFETVCRALPQEKASRLRSADRTSVSSFSSTFSVQNKTINAGGSSDLISKERSTISELNGVITADLNPSKQTFSSTLDPANKHKQTDYDLNADADLNSLTTFEVLVKSALMKLTSEQLTCITCNTSSSNQVTCTNETVFLDLSFHKEFDIMTNILVRLPSGSRLKIRLSNQQKLEDLLSVFSALGYCQESHRLLSPYGSTQTVLTGPELGSRYFDHSLLTLGLFPQATVYLEDV